MKNKLCFALSIITLTLAMACSDDEIIVDPEPEVGLHDAWTTLLQKHVSETAKVNYAGFINDIADLGAYLNSLTVNEPSSDSPQNEQLAYWINVYNAFTVKLITQHYPLNSILDIAAPWDTPMVTIGDSLYTLNQVEHEIIRPRFGESRIHFAVNCASISCPRLLNEAYTADQLTTQLEAQTKAFINDTLHNNLVGNPIYLSQLFNWYGQDFLDEQPSIIQYLNNYSNTPIDENTSIEYKEYNWNLNE